MKTLPCLLFFFLSNALSATPTDAVDGELKRWAIGINVTETIGFVAGKYIIDWPVTLIPIHVDGNYCFNETWGLGFGAVYRYENYYDKNPINKGRLTDLWTNYHEIFLMAGPRYSFFGQGNRGLYAALKIGLGGGFSAGGYAITAVGQPEIGYSFLFGETLAFHLDLAAGLLLNMPISEKPSLGFSLSPVGWLVHRTTPIIRVGLGIAF